MLGAELARKTPAIAKRLRQLPGRMEPNFDASKAKLFDLLGRDEVDTRTIAGARLRLGEVRYRVTHAAADLAS